MDEPAHPVLRRFEGRTAVVSGAGTGFGAALANAAASEGADVVVHYNRSREGAEATASRVRAHGSDALILQADIRDWESVRRLASSAFSWKGSVDVLVNNVGDMAVGQQSWKDISEEEIDRVLAVDVKGTMLMLHEFGTRMLDQGHGSIVNVASTVIVRGSPRAPQYAAGKYGVIGLTKSYATALAPTVRVNAFAPGFMETEAMVSRQDWKSGRKEKLIAATPAGRIPSPDDLAPTALFLASDQAAHMYGALLVADGGYSMIGA